MPTRRSNRLRAAQTATATSTTPDVAPAFGTAPVPAEQIAPAFGSAPAAEQVAPAFGAAPAAERIAPAFASVPTTERVPTTEQVAPAFTGAPATAEVATVAETTAVAQATTAAEVATVAVVAAATSRRARRQAAAGAPVAQPITGPAEVVVRPAEPVAPVAEPIVVESAVRVTEPVVTGPVVTESVVTEPVAPESVSAASESAKPAGSRTVASDADAFAMASDAFGFTAVDDDPEVVFEATTVPVADEPVTEGATPTHVAPRRPRRMLRRAVAAGASFGVMGVAGLIAVSMTLPVSAVAASQGADARTSASLVATGDDASAKVADDEIQAYVASSDVEGEVLARSDSFETVSLSEVAAEKGIKFSESLYTNDPDAAIQWPFIVGVAMSSPYGTRWGRLHAGIDLVPGSGAPIQAIADGVVRTATESGGAYGVTVYIDHVIDGQQVTSHYAHMQHGSLQVQAGQHVKVGDIVGRVGNTGRSYGAHLHFEIIINGSTVDPLPWMRKNAGRYEY